MQRRQPTDVHAFAEREPVRPPPGLAAVPTTVAPQVNKLPDNHVLSELLRDAPDRSILQWLAK